MFGKNLLGRRAKCGKRSVVIIGESLDNGVHKVKIRFDGGGSNWVPKKEVNISLITSAEVKRKRITLKDGQEVYIGMKVLDAQDRVRYITGYATNASDRPVKRAFDKKGRSPVWLTDKALREYKAANPVCATVNEYKNKVCRQPLLVRAGVFLAVAFIIDYFVFSGKGYHKIKDAVARLVTKLLDAIEAKVAS